MEVWSAPVRLHPVPRASDRRDRPTPTPTPTPSTSGTGVPDDTDRVIHQWARVRPNLDVSPIGVIARLARLNAIIDEEMEAFFAEYVVTKPTFSMLVALVRIDEPGGVSQRRLANEMRLTPGTVSTRVDRLVRDGLVAPAAIGFRPQSHSLGGTGWRGHAPHDDS